MPTHQEILRLAKLWRDRAAEARAQAEEMTHDGPRQTLLGIAASYDRLADQEEAVAVALKKNGR